jgi:hypothetical protein
VSYFNKTISLADSYSGEEETQEAVDVLPHTVTKVRHSKRILLLDMYPMRFMHDEDKIDDTNFV